MSNPSISETLIQTTSELAFHIDALLLVEITWGAPGVSRILPSPTLRFPQLVFTLRDFMKSCVVLGEAWIEIVKHSITLFSALSNVDTISEDSKVDEQIRSILVAIKNTSEACVRLRQADMQVRDDCSALPSSAVESLDEQDEAQAELRLFLPYSNSLDARSVLPLEKCLSNLEQLWNSIDIHSLGVALSDPETADKLVSIHRGYIARVCAYANSFKDRTKLAPEFVIPHELHGIKSAPSDLESEDFQHKMGSFIHHIQHSRWDSKVLDLLLNLHLLSAVTLLVAHPPASPEGQPNTVMIAFASSYARVLDNLYGALGCYIKAEIYLFEIRTTASAAFLEDFSSSVQPLLDLCEGIRQRLELAKSEASLLEALTKEVHPPPPPKVLSEEERLLEVLVAQSVLKIPIYDDESVPDPLNCSSCTECILQNSANHVEHIKNELIHRQPWVYTPERNTESKDTGDIHYSITDILDNTFSRWKWSQTLERLREFSSAMSRFQSRCPDRDIALQQYSPQQAEQRLPSIEPGDIYDLFPSLRALVDLNSQGFLHLPHYEVVSQSSVWPAWVMGTRDTQVIPWLDKIPQFRVGSPKYSMMAVKKYISWKPCACKKEQLAIAADSHRVRKAWEETSKTKHTTDVSKSPPSNETTLAGLLSPTQGASSSRQSTAKTARSLQGDWSF